MAEPANIVKFKTQALRALAYLYDRHPQPQLLTFEQVLGPGGKTLNDMDTDWFGTAADPDVTFAVDTIQWLLRHGYIEGEAHQCGAFPAGLNPRSWAALDRPDPLAPSRTLGTSLSAWAKDAVADTAKSGASAGAGMVLNAIAKAVGLPL